MDSADQYVPWFLRDENGRVLGRYPNYSHNRILTHAGTYPLRSKLGDALMKEDARRTGKS